MNYDIKTTHRIKRIEGQLRGILKMIDNERECKDVITQLSAARNAIDRTIGVIVSTNLIECVNEANDKNSEETQAHVEEAVKLLVRSQ